MLAAGKDFGRVVIWDAKQHQFARALDTGQGIVGAVALSGNGRKVATAGDKDDRSIKLWDVATGNLDRLQLGNTSASSLIMDDSGRWLAVRYNLGSLIVIETTTGKPVLTLKDGLAARFSADGSMLIAQDSDGIATWDTVSWSRKSVLPQPKDARRLLLAVDTVDDRFAVLERWSIRILRLSTGELIAEGALPRSTAGIPKGVAFSGDGQLLYASINDHLWVWELRKNTACSSPLMYSSGAALSGDGRWFAGSKDDSILSHQRTDGVWVWDAAHLATACGFAPKRNN